MEKISGNNYICSHCGLSFRFAQKPTYCPSCGNTGTVTPNNQRAKETAQRMIAELNSEDIPVLESLHAGYIAQLAKINAKLDTLRQ